MANSLLVELKQRNVFKVGFAYLVLAWIVVQVTDMAVPALHLPEWVNSLVFFFGLIGFPFALFFAWAFEITPEGVVRESDVKRDESITHVTGRKLDFIIIGLLALALAYFIYESRFASAPEEVAIMEASPKSASATATDEKPVGSSIAVLPFVNMSSDKEQEYFSDGISEEILNVLAQVPNLQVTSRSSSFALKGEKRNLTEIAELLGVENVLEGSVRKSGDRLRITTQLIAAGSDKHLWSSSFDRKLTVDNIFEIQDEIAGAIVGSLKSELGLNAKTAAALKAKLSPQEQQSLAKKPTDNFEAYNAYLAGRQRQQNHTSDDLNQALTLLQLATTLDPNYALAYVGQADILALLFTYSDLSHANMLEQGEPLVAKALALEPELAEAHTTKALYLLERSLYAEAEISFKRSLNLNPNYAAAYQWYGDMLRDHFGRDSEALALHRKAAELDPLSPAIQSTLGFSLQVNGHSEEALAQYHRVIELAPDIPMGSRRIAWLKHRVGDIDEAIIWMRKAAALDKGNPYYAYGLISLHLDIGDVDAASAKLNNLKKIAPQYTRLLWAESQLDFISGNVIGALARMEEAVKVESNELPLIHAVIQFSMLNGHYKRAIDKWTALYPDENGKTSDFTRTNLWLAPTLIWSLMQAGQRQEAERLIAEAVEMSKNRSEFGFLQSELFALQGDPKAAAAAYAETLKDGDIYQWWMIELLPYMAEVIKQPEYITARNQLMGQLAQQRERLDQHDLLEKAE